jgi:hypothetical protein
MKRPPKGPEEQDALTKWRRYLYWRLGTLRAIKRRARRRMRHEASRQLGREE